MALVASGLQTLAATRFQGRLEELRARRAVIATDEGLRERELRKMAALCEAITGGFRDRGLDEVAAALAAQVAVAVFATALARWLDQDGEEALGAFVGGTVAALLEVVRAP